MTTSRIIRASVAAAAVVAVTALVSQASADSALSPYSVTDNCTLAKGATALGTTEWVGTTYAAAYATNGARPTYVSIHCGVLDQYGYLRDSYWTSSVTPVAAGEKLISASANLTLHACVSSVFVSFSDGHVIDTYNGGC